MKLLYYILSKRGITNYSRERDATYTLRTELTALLGMLFLIGVKSENHVKRCGQMMELGLLLRLMLAKSMYVV